MARLAALSGALVALTSAAHFATAQFAAAQELARLHVRSIVMSAQPARVRLGDTLRLLLSIRVGEVVARLDNVTLPDLSDFDVLGDERRCVRVRRGTDCSETLTLVPRVEGTRTIGPATLDAVDATTGRASRFGSNVVKITVTRPAGPGSNEHAVHIVRVLLGALTAVMLVAVAAFALLLVLLAVRRRRMQFVATGADAAPPAVTPSRDGSVSVWRGTIDELRARPTRANVQRARAMLRASVGAGLSETVSELSERGVQYERPSAMEALRLVERAAFTGDERLPAAIADALDALERVPDSS